MGNKESYLRVPPKQSYFGPWFYAPEPNGLADYAFMGVTAFFVSWAVIQFVLLFGIVSEYHNIHDKKKRSEYIKRTLIQTCSLFGMIFLGWVILGTSFAYTWREAVIEGDFLYRVGNPERYPLRLGLHVGLRGVNITLQGLPHEQGGELINWNERYWWSRGQGNIGGWLHGRFGFGPFSNLFAQQFRAGQHRGTPIPILETLEWLTLDGENIRWHRWYHNAGYYCHICLWLAFVAWIFTGITTFMRPSTGMIWLSVTGFCMWFGCALYHGLSQKAHPELAIPFEGQLLKPEFGWAYHLALVVGIIVNLLGIFLWFLFTHLGYTTDAYSLTVAKYEKPVTPAAEPKPLTEVAADGTVTETSITATRAPTLKGSRHHGGVSVYKTRRGSGGTNKFKPATQSSTIGGVSARGRSSRRTKKSFGVNVGEKGSLVGGRKKNLSNLAAALDDLHEDESEGIPLANVSSSQKDTKPDTSTTEV